MNESPGGTPNPLNPSPNGQPTPMSTTPRSSMAPRMARSPQMSPKPIQQVGARRSFGSTAAPLGARPLGNANATNNTTPADTEASMNTMIQSLDPTGRPMEQATLVVEKPPKKKTGLIVAVAALAVLLIGGGVAAALMLLMPHEDVVTKAMERIMDGSTPANVAIDGSIEMRPNDESSVVKSVKIDLDSNLVRSSMVNKSSATVTLSIADMDDISFSFNEVYADSGDLYLKLDGVTNALQSSGLMSILGGGAGPVLQTNGETECDTYNEDDQLQCDTVVEEEVVTGEPVEPLTNCVNDPSGMTNCGPVETTPGGNDSLTTALGVISTIDGQWLRLSTTELGAMTSSGMMPGSDVSCITGLVSKVNSGSSSALEAYKENPFVTSSTEGLTITKKNDSLYKLSIDSEKFANFVNSMNNTELAGEVYSCLGMENNVSITANDIDKIVSEFPEIYAEVNSDYNFTRLYIEGDGESTNMTTIIDLSINYPDNVNVDAPNEYQDMTSVLQTLFSGMYDMPTDNMIIDGDEPTDVGGDGSEIVGGEIVEDQ